MTPIALYYHNDTSGQPIYFGVPLGQPLPSYCAGAATASPAKVLHLLDQQTVGGKSLHSILREIFECGAALIYFEEFSEFGGPRPTLVA